MTGSDQVPEISDKSVTKTKCLWILLKIFENSLLIVLKRCTGRKNHNKFITRVVAVSIFYVFWNCQKKNTFLKNHITRETWRINYLKKVPVQKLNSEQSCRQNLFHFHFVLYRKFCFSAKRSKNIFGFFVSFHFCRNAVWKWKIKRWVQLFSSLCGLFRKMWRSVFS